MYTEESFINNIYVYILFLGNIYDVELAFCSLSVIDWCVIYVVKVFASELLRMRRTTEFNLSSRQLSAVQD